MSEQNSFPKLNRGRGTTWSRREDMESLARGSNLQLARSEGVAMGRTPNGPIIDIYGLQTIRVYSASASWFFLLNPGFNGLTLITNHFRVPNGINERYEIPKTTTTKSFDLFFVKRHSNNDFAPNLGSGQMLLCSNNPDFKGVQFSPSMYYANFTLAEISGNALPVLNLGHCEIDADNNLTYTQAASPYFVHAWIAAMMSFPNISFDWSSWASLATPYTQFSANILRADSEAHTSVTSPNYNTAQSGTLRYNHADNTLAIQATGLPLATVKINDQGRLFFLKPIFGITVPAESALTGSFTYIKTVSGVGVSSTTETINTKRGIIQN